MIVWFVSDYPILAYAIGWEDNFIHGSSPLFDMCFGKFWRVSSHSDSIGQLITSYESNQEQFIYIVIGQIIKSWLSLLTEIPYSII